MECRVLKDHVVEEDRVGPRDGKDHVVTGENPESMGSREVMDHRFLRENRESKEFLAPGGSPV